MLTMRSPLYLSSLETMLRPLDLSALRGKTLLITGATGMIGSCLADALLLWNEGQTAPCTVIVSGRREELLQKRFSSCWDKPYLRAWVHDINQPVGDSFPGQVDYLVHAASNADPVNYSRFPVDTLLANVVGTNSLLDSGRQHGMRRFLYVSSGEMYGQPDAEFHDFTEDYCGPVSHASPRACYPVGKRAGEVLCQAYISQYGVDAVIVRPCHIFGPTMTPADSRAASEFLRSAAQGRNIVLKSAGTVERSHCYVVDAVQAMLLVLLKGACGQAYNIADPAYQMQIRDFAARAAAAGGSRVIFENPSDLEARGYSRVGRAVLDSARIHSLGWRPAAGDAIAQSVRILREAQAE